LAEVTLADDLMPQTQNAALGLDCNEAIPAPIYNGEQGTISPDPLGYIIDGVEARQHLIQRIEARVAENVGKPESFHPAPGDRGSLSAKLEEHAHNREHALNRREHARNLLDRAGGKGEYVTLIVLQIRGTEPERDGEFMLEPSPHLGRRHSYLFGGQRNSDHDLSPDWDRQNRRGSFLRFDVRQMKTRSKVPIEPASSGDTAVAEDARSFLGGCDTGTDVSLRRNIRADYSDRMLPPPGFPLWALSEFPPLRTGRIAASVETPPEGNRPC
jgi:hypothetical protein